MIPSSKIELAAFVVMAAMAVASAIGTVVSRSSIRAAVSLFVHIISLAGLYMALSAHFLVAVQLIVYVGAVVVLFVFVIMMLGSDSDAVDDGSGMAPRAVGALSMVAAGLMMAATLIQFRPERLERPVAFGTLREIGGYLFGPAKLPFEFVSILLTAAMVGAFAVARGHHEKVKMSTGLTDRLPDHTLPGSSDEKRDV